MKNDCIIVAAGLAALAGAAPAAGQIPGFAGCAARDSVAYLGISGIACNCTIPGPGLPWVFLSEPRVTSVDPAGPTHDVLRNGDVIVSAGGHLITTSEGSRQFSRIAAGQPLDLEVRRGGELLRVRVTPSSVCQNDPAVPMMRWSGRGGFGEVVVASATARGGAASPRRSTEPEAAVREYVGQLRAGGRGGAVYALPTATPSEVLPGAWFGFGISCSACTWERGSTNSPPRWSFEETPRILSVEPGSPAYEAGLRSGDVLTHIDGRSLTSAEGGTRFGAVAPGEAVEFTYVRGTADPRTVRITAARRRSVVATTVSPENRYAQLRYSGSVGNTEVEVRGTGSVVTTIIEQGRDLIIVTGDAQIRIRLREGGREEDRQQR